MIYILKTHYSSIIVTRTISKPAKGSEIDYDGETVSVNGFAPDRDPIAGAKSSEMAQKFVRIDFKI
ncbi:MAG: hypothetical protein ABSF90_28960 [Syntrophobacteraceae bacterium]|jgi:hypothetical protein